MIDFCINSAGIDIMFLLIIHTLTTGKALYFITNYTPTILERMNKVIKGNHLNILLIQIVYINIYTYSIYI